MVYNPTTPRARRHDANLARILDAAMQLIASDGIGGLSMTKLADASDYTAGALYRYFPSKTALLSKLVAQILEDVHAHSSRALKTLRSSASPFARVFVLARAYRAFAKADPHRFGLLAMTLAEPRVLLEEREDAEPVSRAMIAAMQPLAEALTTASAAGLLEEGDSQTRTLCIFGMLQGLLQMEKLSRHAPAVLDVDRLVESGVRSLLVGWGARPRTVDAAAAKSAAAHHSTELRGAS